MVSQFLHKHQALGLLTNCRVCGWRCPSSSIPTAGVSRRVPARSRCSSGVVRPSSRHCNSAAPGFTVPGCDRTAPCSHGSWGQGPPRRPPHPTHVWRFPLAVSGAAGEKPKPHGPRVASQRAWGWASSRAGKCKPQGASPLKPGSRMGCHGSILGKLGQGQSWSARGSAGRGCKQLSVFATR